MEQTFEMIAKTFQGLEEVLAEELTNLGANDIEIGRRMVRFTGDKRLLYRANFCLRTAIRILKPILRFTAHNADEVYQAVKGVEWDKYLDLKTTFAIDSVVFSQVFHHSMFVSYKVKDAIADYFREKTGERPNVSLKEPDLRLNIHIAENDCTLSLDSSGESLHRRGYRKQTMEAPLNEVLAAGMILMTGWRGETDFIDPMCGSGTLPIEAALIARNIWPGVYGRHYDFEKWPDFDKNLMDEIYNDDSEEKEFHHHIYGYDLNLRAVEVATLNVKNAGMTHEVTIAQRDIQNFEQPAEKALMVMNPPYGERIAGIDLPELYRTIGERLKHAFIGGQAWIISNKEECFAEIGLKPTRKVMLYNGELECRYQQYEIFDGKYKSFRSEGERLNKAAAPAKPRKDKYDKPREAKGFKPTNDIENQFVFSHEKFKAWEEKENRKRQQKQDRFRKFGKGEPRKNFKEKNEGHPYKENAATPDGRNKGFNKKGKTFRKPWEKSFGPRNGKPDSRERNGRTKAESYPDRKKRELREKLMNNQ